MTTNAIRKYTGHTINMQTLAERDNPLANILTDTVRDLQGTEADLARAATNLAAIAVKIRKNLDAGPEDNVMQLNEIGELQNDPTDRLIAIRQTQITTLRRLVFLANELTA